MNPQRTLSKDRYLPYARSSEARDVDRRCRAERVMYYAMLAQNNLPLFPDRPPQKSLFKIEAGAGQRKPR